MYKALVGIEHLMTGVQMTGKTPDQTFIFERESASVVRVLSDEPFNLYWPAQQTFVKSCKCEKQTELYSIGETKWQSIVMAGAMCKADTAFTQETHSQSNAPVIPWPVIKAMRAKFGERANAWIDRLVWDGLNGCWYFSYNGMCHGVEPDGYIHT